MTRDELLADRTDEPALTNEQFEKALKLAIAEFRAERIVNRRRRRGRPAKHRDLMSNDTDGMLTGADVAELLSGQA